MKKYTLELDEQTVNNIIVALTIAAKQTNIDIDGMTTLIAIIQEIRKQISEAQKTT